MARRDKVTVQLKSGGTIQVFQKEVAGLKKAGVLKEEKKKTATKENKTATQTKQK